MVIIMYFKGRAHLLVVLIFAFHYFSVAYAEQSQPHMEIYSDVPGDKNILAGHFLLAIKEMLHARHENPALLYNNLCVAQTLQRQIIEARKSCNRALRESYRNINLGVTWLERRHSYGKTRREYRARARNHLRILDSVVTQLSANPKRVLPVKQNSGNSM